MKLAKELPIPSGEETLKSNGEKRYTSFRPSTKLNFSYIKRPLLQFKMGSVNSSFVHNSINPGSKIEMLEKIVSGNNTNESSVTSYKRFENSLLNEKGSP